MILVSTQTFPPAIGGIENLMEGFARHGAGRGHEILVLADGGSAARRYDTETATAYRTERFNGPRPWRRWRKARRTASLLREGGIDAIYMDSWKSLEALPPGPISSPVVAYAHGNEIPFQGKKRERITRALGKAAHLIAVSRHTLEQRLTGCLPDSLRPVVLHPPVQGLDTATEADRAFAEDLWPVGALRMLCLCRLIELKGVDQAIRATAAVENTCLVIAGEGPDRARLEALIEDLGLGARVRFAGRVEAGRKTAVLESAQVFLQPGRAVDGSVEAYGISYVEAALAGLPTITGSAGGAQEAIVANETGLVVDGDDTAAVTGAVKRLCDDPALRSRLAGAGKTHGEAALWPRQIDKILAVAGL